MSDALEPAGQFVDGVHRLPIRVYFEDTDLSGIVYHANYLRYAERGRSDYLRAIGIHHSVLLEGDAPVYFTIRKIEIDYMKPARIDDQLQVSSVLVKAKGARFDMAQVIRKGDEVLATLSVKAAIIDGDGKARRLPPAVTAAVEKLGDQLIGDHMLEAL